MSDRALVISFTPIARDSRVLRQLSVVAEHAEVTTVGYGPTPPAATEHLRLPDSATSLPQTVPGVAKLTARRFGAAELAAPATRKALELLGDRRFDVVVANDARALPLAFAVADGAPVWADLHEWAPEERTHVTSWRLLVAPFIDHLCRVYLPRAAATTTVAGSIADLYEQRYGVHPQIMRNAAGFAELAPTPVDGETIRLAHSGSAVYGRRLEETIDAAVALGGGFSLDLYLVPANDDGKYLRQLRARADGLDRIRFHAPVPPHELATTLNRYDVGVFWIPPFNTNARFALPNKLFDFVQARLAIAIGPSVEMQRVVEEYALGVVADGFDAAAAAASLRGVTRAEIARYKAAAHAAARELSFEKEAAVAHGILTDLLGR